MEHKVKSGELFIVATPIGNLGDISLRALEILKSADTVYCEDTRHSRKLLERHGISTPLAAYHEHNGKKMRPIILQKLEVGKHLALISDAGTPLISDPGYKLVEEARNLEIKVTPIPGACAAITALSASGLPSDRFLFVGFLPPKQQARRKALAAIAQIDATLIFYESPKRLANMLNDANESLGSQRAVVVARELTKQFETFYKGSLANIAAEFAAQDTPKGEIVVLIGAASGNEKELTEDELKSLLRAALNDLPMKQAAAQVAEQTGFSKRDCYQLALSLKDNR